MFNVSRRLIQFIGDSSKKVRNLEVRKARGGSMAYYNKEKQRQYMKNNRKYKQELYLNNKLIGQEPKKDSKIVQIEN